MLAERLNSLKIDKPVLILPHNNPDPDALASAWGISFILQSSKGHKSKIAYGGLIGRAENRALVRVLGIPAQPARPDLFQTPRTIIMVDCQPYTGNSLLPEDITPDLIVDHHPRRDTTRFMQSAVIEENIGATSTLVTQAMRDLRLTIPHPLATALFYAIRSETKDLGWEGTRQDYENYIYLLPKIDFKALFHIAYPPLSSDYYRVVKEAIVRSRIRKFLVTCPLNEIPYPELPAEIADFLIFKDDIHVSFVMGWFDSSVFLSLRSIRSQYNSSEIIRYLVKGLGTGGGHEIMAGGMIPDVPRTKARDLANELIRRLLKYLSLSRAREKKLF